MSQQITNKKKYKKKQKQNQNQNRKKFKTLKCAPKQMNNVSLSLKGKSCYSNSYIFNLKNSWNNNNSKHWS